MRELNQILFPTDLSENSQSALPAAIAMAKRSGAVLHLLRVVQPLPWSARFALESSNVEAIEADLRQHSEDELREMAAKLGDEIRTEIHVEEGTPAETIAEFVGAKSIDLVVLATMGHTGLKRFTHGSTTEKIARLVPCPVLVVRERPQSWDTLTKIIVPVDFSELSSTEIEEAVALARPSNAEVVLAHIIEDTDYPTGRVLKGHGILDVREQARKGARAYLETIQADRIGDAVPSSIAVREGPPSPTLADLADVENADLIVIATHGRAGLSRFVLGSTAERCVRLAPCSVLVVKQRD